MADSKAEFSIVLLVGLFAASLPYGYLGGLVHELAQSEHRYNHERFSMALGGRAPMEKLATLTARSLCQSRAEHRTAGRE